MYMLSAMFVGAVIGAVIMDFMWAWRLGIPQRMWQRYVQRRERTLDSED